MATSKQQAKWRERSSNGLIEQNPICPGCGRKIKAGSSKAPYHFKCWLKTDNGREYMREKQKQSRVRKKG